MAAPTLIHDETAEVLDIGLPGGAMATAGTGKSGYHTEIGEPGVDVETVTVLGVSGELHTLHGLRGRPIVISGHLRVSAAALATVREQRDRLIGLGGLFTFADWDGTEYVDCRLESFAITDVQAIQPEGSIDWRAQYVIRLRQMEV